MHFVVSHPLVSHRIAMMRDQETTAKEFRELLGELTVFLAYEALGDLRTVRVPIATPIAATTGERLAERIVAVPILRAGFGMLDAALRVIPSAVVGFIGMARNEDTGVASPYYSKVPSARGEELAVVLDPMLATGNSAIDVVGELKRLGYRRIRFLNLIAAKEGLARFEAAHPDVAVWTAAVDERLDERFYIVPGLGDAGDRIFATEETTAASRMMKELERKMMADGRVDFAETDELLRLARPLVAMSADFAEFRRVLDKVRADGTVDAGESRRLAGILAALADKADAFAVRSCPKCARPISTRTLLAGAAICPWCGEVANFQDGGRGDGA